MIASTHPGGAARRLRSPFVWLAFALPCLAPPALVGQEPVNAANYKQATKFSTRFLRKFVYDSSVRPQWIGDSERFWYRFRNSSGTRYWLVDPVARTKVPLFDHESLAALLIEACETPVPEDGLDLGNVEFDDGGDEMTFTTKELKFAYVRSTGRLEKKGKAERSSRSSRGAGGTRGRLTRERSRSTCSAITSRAPTSRRSRATSAEPGSSFLVFWFPQMPWEERAPYEGI